MLCNDQLCVMIFKCLVCWAALSKSYRFTTYQDARRVRLVDDFTSILRVSPVNPKVGSTLDLSQLFPLSTMQWYELIVL